MAKLPRLVKSVDKSSITPCLSRFPQSTHLLALTADYVLLNKPHDLRMDGGAGEETVEKLLLYWFPHANRNQFKWIHQLDYATSGILCVARNKSSAHVASQAFEYRRTTKYYTSMLEGHVNPRQFVRSSSTTMTTADFTIREDDLGSQLQKLAEHKLQRHVENCRTADNELGSHGLSSGGGQTETNWQERTMRHNLSVYHEALCTHIRDCGEEASAELRKLASTAIACYVKSHKLRKALRKAVKALANRSVIPSVESALLPDSPPAAVAGHVGNDYKTAAPTAAATLPAVPLEYISAQETLLYVRSGDIQCSDDRQRDDAGEQGGCTSRCYDDDYHRGMLHGTINVTVSIAEQPSSFRMLALPSSTTDVGHGTRGSDSSIDQSISQLPSKYKPRRCRTTVYVNAYGYHQGMSDICDPLTIA